jgi:hypothetical protein
MAPIVENSTNVVCNTFCVLWWENSYLCFTLMEISNLNFVASSSLPVLPDGIFSNQKCQFGLSLECLAMNDVGKFYGHLVYFSAIWSIFLQFGIFWSFGLFHGYLVYFPFVGMLYQEKSGNPARDASMTQDLGKYLLKFSVTRSVLLSTVRSETDPHFLPQGTSKSMYILVIICHHVPTLSLEHLNLSLNLTMFLKTRLTYRTLYPK